MQCRGLRTSPVAVLPFALGNGSARREDDTRDRYRLCGLDRLRFLRRKWGIYRLCGTSGPGPEPKESRVVRRARHATASWPPSGLPRRKPRLAATATRSRIYSRSAAASRRPERVGETTSSTSVAARRCSRRDEPDGGTCAIPCVETISAYPRGIRACPDGAALDATAATLGQRRGRRGLWLGGGRGAGDRLGAAASRRTSAVWGWWPSDAASRAVLPIRSVARMSAPAAISRLTRGV